MAPVLRGGKISFLHIQSGEDVCKEIHYPLSLNMSKTSGSVFLPGTQKNPHSPFGCGKYSGQVTT